MISESDFVVDTTQATDLIVLTLKPFSVACRVRRNEYLERYKNEFTIRSKLESGTETELSKIVNGFGDYMFYGFASKVHGKLAEWYLINLDSFRAAMIRRNSLNIIKGKKSNNDGTYFCWFKIDSFPANPPLLIARSNGVVVT